MTLAKETMPSDKEKLSMNLQASVGRYCGVSEQFHLFCGVFMAVQKWIYMAKRQIIFFKETVSLKIIHSATGSLVPACYTVVHGFFALPVRKGSFAKLSVPILFLVRSCTFTLVPFEFRVTMQKRTISTVSLSFVRIYTG